MNCCANTEKSVKKVTEVKKKTNKKYIKKVYMHCAYCYNKFVKKTVDYVIITKRELLKNQ